MADETKNVKKIEYREDGSVSSVATDISGIAEFKARLKKLSQTANGLLESIDKVMVKRRTTSKPHLENRDKHGQRRKENVSKSDGSLEDVDTQFAIKPQSSNYEISHHTTHSPCIDSRPRNTELPFVTDLVDRRERNTTKSIRKEISRNSKQSTQDSSHGITPQTVFMDEIKELLSVENRDLTHPHHKRNQKITKTSHLLENNHNLLLESDLDGNSTSITCECDSKCPFIKARYRIASKEGTFTSNTTKEHSKGSGDYVSSRTSCSDDTKNKFELPSIANDGARKKDNSDYSTVGRSLVSDTLVTSDRTDLTFQRNNQLTSSTKPVKHQKQSETIDASLSQPSSTLRTSSGEEYTHSEATEESANNIESSYERKEEYQPIVYDSEGSISMFSGSLSSSENNPHQPNLRVGSKSLRKYPLPTHHITHSSENLSMSHSANSVSSQILTPNRTQNIDMLNLSKSATSFTSTESSTGRTQSSRSELCSQSIPVVGKSPVNLPLPSSLSCSQVKYNSKPSDSISRSFTSTSSFLESIANNRNCHCCESAKCYRCQTCVDPDQLNRKNSISGVSSNSISSGQKACGNDNLPSVHHSSHSISSSQYSEYSETFGNAQKFKRMDQKTSVDTTNNGRSFGKSLTMNESTSPNDETASNPDSRIIGYTPSKRKTTTVKLAKSRTSSDMHTKSYDSGSESENSFTIKTKNRKTPKNSSNEMNASTDEGPTYFSASYLHKTTATNSSVENQKSSHIKSMCMYSDFLDAESSVISSKISRSQNAEENVKSFQDKSYIVDTLYRESAKIDLGSLQEPRDALKLSLHPGYMLRDKLLSTEPLKAEENSEQSESKGTSYTKCSTKEEFEHDQYQEEDTYSDYVEERSLSYTRSTTDSCPMVENMPTKHRQKGIENSGYYFGKSSSLETNDFEDSKDSIISVQNNMKSTRKQFFKKEEVYSSSCYCRRCLYEKNDAYRVGSNEKMVHKTHLPCDSVMSESSSLDSPTSTNSEMTWDRKERFHRRETSCISSDDAVENKKQIDLSTSFIKSELISCSCVASSCQNVVTGLTSDGVTSGKSLLTSYGPSVTSSANCELNSEIDQSFSKELDSDSFTEKPEKIPSLASSCHCERSSCQMKRSSKKTVSNNESTNSVLSSSLDFSTNQSILSQKQQNNTRHSTSELTTDNKNYRNKDIRDNRCKSKTTSSQTDLSDSYLSGPCIQDTTSIARSFDNTSDQTNASKFKSSELTTSLATSQHSSTCVCTNFSCLEETPGLQISSTSNMAHIEMNSNEEKPAGSNSGLEVNENSSSTSVSSLTPLNNKKVSKENSFMSKKFCRTIESSKLGESGEDLIRSRSSSCSCKNAQCLQRTTNYDSKHSETSLPGTSAAFEIESGSLKSSKDSCFNLISKVTYSTGSTIGPMGTSSYAKMSHTISSFSCSCSNPFCRIERTNVTSMSVAKTERTESRTEGNDVQFMSVNKNLDNVSNKSLSNSTERTNVCSSILIITPAPVGNNEYIRSETICHELRTSFSTSTDPSSSSAPSLTTKNINLMNDTRDAPPTSAQEIPSSNLPDNVQNGPATDNVIKDKDNKARLRECFENHGKTKYSSSEISISSGNENKCSYKTKKSKNHPTIIPKIFSACCYQTSSTSCSACKQLWNDESLHYSSEDSHCNEKMEVVQEAKNVGKIEVQSQIDHQCFCCICSRRPDTDHSSNPTNNSEESCSKIRSTLEEENKPIQSSNCMSSTCNLVDSDSSLLEKLTTSCEPSSFSLSIPPHATRSQAKLFANYSSSLSKQLSKSTRMSSFASFTPSASSSFTKCPTEKSFLEKAENLFLVKSSKKSLSKTKICKCKICEKRGKYKGRGNTSKVKTSTSEPKINGSGQDNGFIAITKQTPQYPSSENVKTANQSSDESNKFAGVLAKSDEKQANSNQSLREPNSSLSPNNLEICPTVKPVFSDERIKETPKLPKIPLVKSKVCRCSKCGKRKRKNQNTSKRRETNDAQILPDNPPKDFDTQKSDYSEVSIDLSASGTVICSITSFSTTTFDENGINLNKDVHSKDTLSARIQTSSSSTKRCPTENHLLDDSKLNPDAHPVEGSQSKDKICKCSKCGRRKKGKRKPKNMDPDFQKLKKSLEVLTQSSLPGLSSICNEDNFDSLESLSLSNVDISDSKEHRSDGESSIEKVVKGYPELQKPIQSTEALTVSSIPKSSSKSSSFSDSFESLSSYSRSSSQPNIQSSRGSKKLNTVRKGTSRSANNKSSGEVRLGLNENETLIGRQSSTSLSGSEKFATGIQLLVDSVAKPNVSPSKEAQRKKQTCRCSKCGRKKKGTKKIALEKAPELQRTKKSVEVLSESSIPELSSKCSARTSDSVQCLSSSNIDWAESCSQITRSEYYKNEAMARNLESTRPKKSLEALTESSIHKLSSNCSSSKLNSSTGLGYPSTSFSKPSDKNTGSDCLLKENSVGMIRDRSNDNEPSNKIGLNQNDNQSELDQESKISLPTSERCSTEIQFIKKLEICKCCKCEKRKQTSTLGDLEVDTQLQRPQRSLEILTESSVPIPSPAHRSSHSDFNEELSYSNIDSDEYSHSSSRSKFLKVEEKPITSDLPNRKESLDALTESSIPEISNGCRLSNSNSLESLSSSCTSFIEPSTESNSRKRSMEENTEKYVMSQSTVFEYNSKSGPGRRSNISLSNSERYAIRIQSLPDLEAKRNENVLADAKPKTQICKCSKCGKRKKDTKKKAFETNPDLKKPRKSFEDLTESSLPELLPKHSANLTDSLESLSSSNVNLGDSSARSIRKAYLKKSAVNMDPGSSKFKESLEVLTKSSLPTFSSLCSTNTLNSFESLSSSNIYSDAYSIQIREREDSPKQASKMEENTLDPTESLETLTESSKPDLTPQPSANNSGSRPECSRSARDSKRHAQKSFRKRCQCKKCYQRRKQIKASARKVTNNNDMNVCSHRSWLPVDSDSHISIATNLHPKNVALSHWSHFDLLGDRLEYGFDSCEMTSSSHYVGKHTNNNKQYKCHYIRRRQTNESDSDMERINYARGSTSKRTKKGSVLRRPNKRPPKHYETGSSRGEKPSNETTDPNAPLAETEPSTNHQGCPCSPCVEPVQTKSNSTTENRNQTQAEIFETNSIEVKPHDFLHPKTGKLTSTDPAIVQNPCVFQAQVPNVSYHEHILVKPFNVANAFLKPRVPQLAFNDSFESEDSYRPSGPLNRSPVYNPTKPFDYPTGSKICVCNEVCTGGAAKRLFPIEVKTNEPKRETICQHVDKKELLGPANMQLSTDEPVEIEIKATNLNLTQSRTLQVRKNDLSPEFTNQKNNDPEQCPCDESFKLFKSGHIKPVETKQKGKVSARSSFKSVISEYEAVFVKRKDNAPNIRSAIQPAYNNLLSSESAVESLIQVKSYKEKIIKSMEGGEHLNQIPSNLHLDFCPCSDPCTSKNDRIKTEPVKSKPLTCIQKPSTAEGESPTESEVDLIEVKPLRFKQKTVFTTNQSEDPQFEVQNSTQSAADFEEIDEIEVKQMFTRVMTPKPVFGISSSQNITDNPCGCNPYDENPPKTEPISVKHDNISLLKERRQSRISIVYTKDFGVKEEEGLMSPSENMKKNKNHPNVTFHSLLTNPQDSQCVSNDCQRGEATPEPPEPDGIRSDFRVNLSAEDIKLIEVKKDIIRISSHQRVREKANPFPSAVNTALNVAMDTETIISKKMSVLSDTANKNKDPESPVSEPIAIKKEAVAITPWLQVEKISNELPLATANTLLSGAENSQCLCHPYANEEITAVPVTYKPDIIQRLQGKLRSPKKEIDNMEPIEIKKRVVRLKSVRQAQDTKSTPIVPDKTNLINANGIQSTNYLFDEEQSKPDPVRVKNGDGSKDKYKVASLDSDVKNFDTGPVAIESQETKTEKPAGRSSFLEQSPELSSEPIEISTFETHSRVPSEALFEIPRGMHCPCNDPCYSQLNNLQPQSSRIHTVSLKPSNLTNVFQMPKVGQSDILAWKESTTRPSDEERLSAETLPTASYQGNLVSSSENKFRNLHEAGCACKRCKGPNQRSNTHKQPIELKPVYLKPTSFGEMLLKPKISQALKNVEESLLMEPIEVKTTVSIIKPFLTEIEGKYQQSNSLGTEICECNCCQECNFRQLNSEELLKGPVQVRHANIAPVLQRPKLLHLTPYMWEKETTQTTETKEKERCTKLATQDESKPSLALILNTTETLLEKPICESASHTCGPFKIHSVRAKPIEVAQLLQRPKINKISQNYSEVLLSMPVEVKNDAALDKKTPEPAKYPIPVTEINQSHCTCDICNDRSRCQNPPVECQPAKTETISRKHADVANFLQQLRVTVPMQTHQESNFEERIEVKTDNAHMDRITLTGSVIEIHRKNDVFHRRTRDQSNSACRLSKSEPIVKKTAHSSNMFQKPKVPQPSEDLHEMFIAEPVERKHELPVPTAPIDSSHLKWSRFVAYVRPNSETARECQCQVCEDKSKCHSAKQNCNSPKFEPIAIKSFDTAKLMQAPRVPVSAQVDYRTHIEQSKLTKPKKAHSEILILFHSKQPTMDNRATSKQPRQCKCSICEDRTKCQSPKKDCETFKVNPLNLKLPDPVKIVQKPRIPQPFQDDDERHIEEASAVKMMVPGSKGTTRPVASLTNIKCEEHDPKYSCNTCENLRSCFRHTKSDPIVVKLTDASKLLRKPKIAQPTSDEYEFSFPKLIDVTLKAEDKKTPKNQINAPALKFHTGATSSAVSRHCKCSICEDRSQCHLPKSGCMEEQNEPIQVKPQNFANILQRPRVPDLRKTKSVDTKVNSMTLGLPSLHANPSIESVDVKKEVPPVKGTTNTTHVRGCHCTICADKLKCHSPPGSCSKAPVELVLLKPSSLSNAIQKPRIPVSMKDEREVEFVQHFNEKPTLELATLKPAEFSKGLQKPKLIAVHRDGYETNNAEQIEIMKAMKPRISIGSIKGGKKMRTVSCTNVTQIKSAIPKCNCTTCQNKSECESPSTKCQQIKLEPIVVKSATMLGTLKKPRIPYSATDENEIQYTEACVVKTESKSVANVRNVQNCECNTCENKLKCLSPLNPCGPVKIDPVSLKFDDLSKIVQKPRVPQTTRSEHAIQLSEPTEVKAQITGKENPLISTRTAPNNLVAQNVVDLHNELIPKCNCHSCKERCQIQKSDCEPDVVAPVLVKNVDLSKGLQKPTVTQCIQDNQRSIFTEPIDVKKSPSEGNNREANSHKLTQVMNNEKQQLGLISKCDCNTCEDKSKCVYPLVQCPPINKEPVTVKTIDVVKILQKPRFAKSGLDEHEVPLVQPTQIMRKRSFAKIFKEPNLDPSKFPPQPTNMKFQYRKSVLKCNCTSCQDRSKCENSPFVCPNPAAKPIQVKNEDTNSLQKPRILGPLQQRNEIQISEPVQVKEESAVKQPIQLVRRSKSLPLVPKATKIEHQKRIPKCSCSICKDKSKCQSPSPVCKPVRVEPIFMKNFDLAKTLQRPRVSQPMEDGYATEPSKVVNIKTEPHPSNFLAPGISSVTVSKASNLAKMLQKPKVLQTTQNCNGLQLTDATKVKELAEPALKSVSRPKMDDVLPTKSIPKCNCNVCEDRTKCMTPPNCEPHNLEAVTIKSADTAKMFLKPRIATSLAGEYINFASNPIQTKEQGRDIPRASADSSDISSEKESDEANTSSVCSCTECNESRKRKLPLERFLCIGCLPRNAGGSISCQLLDSIDNCLMLNTSNNNEENSTHTPSDSDSNPCICQKPPVCLNDEGISPTELKPKYPEKRDKIQPKPVEFKTKLLVHNFEDRQTVCSIDPSADLLKMELVEVKLKLPTTQKEETGKIEFSAKSVRNASKPQFLVKEIHNEMSKCKECMKSKEKDHIQPGIVFKPRTIEAVKQNPLEIKPIETKPIENRKTENLLPSQFRVVEIKGNSNANVASASEVNSSHETCACDNICGPATPIIDPITLKPSAGQVTFRRPRIPVDLSNAFERSTYLEHVETKKENFQKFQHVKKCDCIKCGGSEICKMKLEECKPKPVEYKEKAQTVEQNVSLAASENQRKDEKTKHEDVKGMKLPLEIKTNSVEIHIPVETKPKEPVLKQVQNPPKSSPIEIKSSPIRVMVPVETSQSLSKSKEYIEEQAKIRKGITKAPNVPVDIKQFEPETRDGQKILMLQEQSSVKIKSVTRSLEPLVESTPVRTKLRDSKSNEVKQEKKLFLPTYPIETKSDHNISKTNSATLENLSTPVETKTKPETSGEIEGQHKLPIKTKPVSKRITTKSSTSMPTVGQTLPVLVKPPKSQTKKECASIESSSLHKSTSSIPVVSKSISLHSLQKYLSKESSHDVRCPCKDCKEEVHLKKEDFKIKSPTGVVLLKKPRTAPISLTEQTQSAHVKQSTSHWKECSCEICQNKKDCKYGPKGYLAKKRKFNFSGCCEKRSRSANSISISEQSEVEPNISVPPEAIEKPIRPTGSVESIELKRVDTPTDSGSLIKRNKEVQIVPSNLPETQSQPSVKIIFPPQPSLESSGETMLCSTTTTYIESSIDTWTYCNSKGSKENFSSSQTSWCTCPTHESSSCICDHEGELSDKFLVICEGKQVKDSAGTVNICSTSSLWSCVSSCSCMQKESTNKSLPTKIPPVLEERFYEKVVPPSTSEAAAVTSVESKSTCSEIIGSEKEESSLSCVSLYSCNGDELSNEICSDNTCRCSNDALPEKLYDSSLGSSIQISSSALTCDDLNAKDGTEASQHSVSLELNSSLVVTGITDNNPSQSFRSLSNYSESNMTRDSTKKTPLDHKSTPSPVTPNPSFNEESMIKKGSKKSSSTIRNNMSGAISSSCIICSLSTGGSTMSVSSMELEKKMEEQPNLHRPYPSTETSKARSVCPNKCGCPDCPFLQHPPKSKKTTKKTKPKTTTTETSRPQPCGCSTQKPGKSSVDEEVRMPSAMRQPENVLRICMMPNGCSATCGRRCGSISKGYAGDETNYNNSARSLLDSDTEIHGISETAKTLFKFVLAELKHIKDIIQRNFNVDSVNNCLNIDNNRNKTSNTNSNSSVCRPTSNCPCISLNQYYPQRFRHVHDVRRYCIFSELKPFVSVPRLPICLSPMYNNEINITHPLPSTTSCYPETSVKILSVKPVGCESLMVTWLLDPGGKNDGYEIFVDNSMKCRTFTPTQNTAIVNGVDTDKKHQIRVIAVPNNGQTSRNSQTLRGLYLPAECRTISAHTCYYQPPNSSI